VSVGVCDDCNRYYVLDQVRRRGARCPNCHQPMREGSRDELRAFLRQCQHETAPEAATPPPLEGEQQGSETPRSASNPETTPT
jgi:hypothetical protein